MTINGPKHIFCAFLAACAMASCVSESSEPEQPQSGQKVRFDIHSLTRGSVTKADNIKANSFVVFGDVKYTYNAESEQPTQSTDVLLNAIEVRYVPDSARWISSTDRFWHPNAEHSFVAVHPYKAIDWSGTTYQNNSLSFKYTLPESFRDTYDLLLATHRRSYQDKKNSPASSVKLKFFHAFSRINFSLLNETYEKITVTNITLEGVDKSGTFSITPAPLTSGSMQTDDYSFSWTDFSDRGTLSADIDVEVEDDETVSLFPDSNALFVIPQKDNTGITLTITYKDKNGELHSLDAEAFLGNWELGKIYTHNITIKTPAQAIDLTVDVADWIPGSDSEVDVPRK
ncbi:MAG: fimbrillin family protein [Muribaculaceae bacterium]|nr:fimbrillin family protein [Muribaculaceae bacterium]